MRVTDETGFASRINILTDTVFGVAMTILAASLFQRRDAWPSMTPRQILDDLRPQLTALALSFVIGGLFWVSQHRRLSVTPNRGELAVYGNLAFLLAALFLPVTTTFYGAKPGTSLAFAVYVGDLALLSGLNLILWTGALRHEARCGNPLSKAYLIGPCYSTSIFVVAAVVARYDLCLAQLTGLMALAGPIVDWVARHGGQTPPFGGLVPLLTRVLTRGLAVSRGPTQAPDVASSTQAR